MLFGEPNTGCLPCTPQWGPNALETLPSLWFFLGCMRLYTKLLNPERPHIVFMVADDLGWNDVSFHGSKQIPTPNIDAVARDGIILNQYYVQPLCSPSRGSLMTGKYAIRIGFEHSVILRSSPWGLPLNEKILPQYLKAFRYSTHAVGKWHLGFFKKEYLPLERGFDSFFGYYGGKEDYFTHVAIMPQNDMQGLDLHDNEKNVWQYNGTYGPDLFTDKAREIILQHDPNKNDMQGLDLHDNEKNVWQYNGTYGPYLFTDKAREIILQHHPNKPLFLYIAQQTPHSGNSNSPLQAPKKYVKPMMGIENKKREIYAGMMSSLDHSVGEIFNALEISGMLDDTLFIFTTDNGGATQGSLDGTSGSNWPLKGAKRTLWEGGIRGVSFVWSPFLRCRSRVYNELMHISDWLPTILSAIGGQQALKMLPKNIDGVDQWPSIAHGVPSPRSEVLLNIDVIENMEAIRIGRYKLLKGTYGDGENDKWYDREGRVFNTIHSLETRLQKELYRKNYLRFLRRSKAARILWQKYGRDPHLAISCTSSACEEHLEVKCGVPPPTLNCDAKKEYCLYDIINDPCEFYNIAEALPNVTAEMIKAIEKYRAVSVPPGNLPSDPAADPKFHGNVWEPWK